jgi:hypothetical protein
MNRIIIHRLISSYLSIMFFLSFSHGLSAQVDSLKNPDQFLFREFSVGLVKLKDSVKIALNLNYNIVTEKMVFMQKNQIYDMVNYDAVDTIYISQKKFIPVGKVFYELMVKGEITLFVQHTGSIKSPSKPAAYGGTSDVSSSTYISNMKIGTENFRMKPNPEVVVIQDPIFWVLIDNKLQAVTGKNFLLNLFGGKKKEMKDFIGKYNLKEDDPDDMTRIITYYNSLSR